MGIVYSRCSGLDIHKETVVACVSIREGGKVQREVQTFQTMTSDLLALRDRLMVHQVTHIAMSLFLRKWGR